MGVNTLFLLAVFTAAFSVIQADNYNCTDSSWQQFKEKYKKVYASSTDEAQAKSNFCKNVADVNAHNFAFARKQATYKIGINAFSDMIVVDTSNKTSSSKLLGFVPGRNGLARPLIVQALGGSPPFSKNWVSEGKVTPVKNQGSVCGSCWAHAVTGALEAHTLISGGPQLDLSEQELVDCSWKYGNDGCGGGSASAGFDYVRAKNGLWQRETDPYEGSDNSCPTNSGAERYANIRSYLPVPEGDETALMSVVGLKGPVTIALYVSNSFKAYDSGVYSSDPVCEVHSSYANHAVLLVGYGTDSATNTPYWLIKNSWGTDWGENGYIRLKRGINLCSVANYAVYPVLAPEDYNKHTPSPGRTTTEASEVTTTEANAQTFEITSATMTTDDKMKTFALTAVKTAVRQNSDYYGQCEAIVDQMETEYNAGGRWLCSVAASETFTMNLQDKQNAVVIKSSDPNSINYLILQQQCTPSSSELTVTASNKKVNYGSYKVIVNDTDFDHTFMQMMIDAATTNSKQPAGVVTKTVHDNLAAKFGGYWSVLYGNISEVYSHYNSPYYIWIKGGNRDLVSLMNTECFESVAPITTPSYDSTFQIVERATKCTDEDLKAQAVSSATRAASKYTSYFDQCQHITHHFDKRSSSDGSWLCSISYSETYTMASANDNEIMLSTTTSAGRTLYYLIRQQKCTTDTSIKDVTPSTAVVNLGAYRVFVNDTNYDHNQMKTMIDTVNADASSKKGDSATTQDLYNALQAKFGGNWSILFGDINTIYSHYNSHFYIWLTGPHDVAAMMNAQC